MSEKIKKIFIKIKLFSLQKLLDVTLGGSRKWKIAVVSTLLFIFTEKFPAEYLVVIYSWYTAANVVQKAIEKGVVNNVVQKIKHKVVKDGS
mgnify:CR=1 FL=1